MIVETIDLNDLLAGYLVFTKILIIAVAAMITISSIDDTFIDLYYWTRTLYRRLFVYNRYPRLTIEQLRAEPEGAFAIMVPAWQESPVIAHMLGNALASLEYDNLRIFVGTYPNDPDTQREVALMRDRDSRIQLVVCPNDGPTSKADCLNWIVQAITLYEEENDVRFAGLVMHDAEDVVHPLELRMFNYLIPRFDFVQLPVYPLEAPWWNLTAGHYMDEFAENHGKDLVVRESLISQVPCAGVAAGFSRAVIERMAEATDNLIFDVTSVTEDYEFTFRLYQMGIIKQIFVRFGVERTVERRPLPFMRPRPVRIVDYVATREFFPDKFRPAVRQKGRWIVGIAFQGWLRIGWRGPLGVRYILMRDRKVILTSAVILLGYVIAFNISVMWLISTFLPWIMRFPTLIEPDSATVWLLAVNGVFLLNRLGQRIYFVTAIYGPFQAALTLPRQFWGNIVNFFAVIRALRLFIGFLRSGRQIAWDKTAHAFPSPDQLRTYREKIGVLLLTDGALTVEKLNEAIARQAETGQPLGEVLLDLGFVGEDALYAGLSRQLSLPLAEVDPDAISPSLLTLVPMETAVRYALVPIDERDDGTLVVASSRPYTQADKTAVSEAIGRPIEWRLARRSDIAYALRRAYARDDTPTGGETLGQRLLRDGSITEETLGHALLRQRRGYRSLGQILVAAGALRQEALDDALASLSRESGLSLGAYLLGRGEITEEQLRRALEQQRRESPRLGEILVDLSAISPRDIELALSSPETAER